jgi:tetratricopeptide (TPR) repeat protein
MSALRKPRRIAVLVPELGLDAGDAGSASAASLVLWIACIEACQRHPGLSVLDAEATPLVAQDGQFAPDRARPGAAPDDAFYGPSRRDELIWLELALGKPGAVRLHSAGREGVRERFEPSDPSRRGLGDQIHQVIERWLQARELAPPPRRFEAVELGDVMVAARAIAPVLSEQARAFVAVEDRSAALPDPGASQRPTAMGADSAGPLGDPDSEQLTGDGLASALPRSLADSRRLARALAARLPGALRAPALRLLALALREDLGEVILAADPEQPQALFDRYRAAGGRDEAMLRRIIASAPGWAAPYAALGGGSALRGAPGPTRGAARSLDSVAGASFAALCRPEQRDALEAVASQLAETGRTDEAIRWVERAVALELEASAPHLALIDLYRRAERRGAWLAQAVRSGELHGCAGDAELPRYPDQIQIDLLVSDALLGVGRLDEAIALRADRLDGREASWPRHARVLTSWRRDPRLVARCDARDAHLRGDPGRVVAGYRRSEPEDSGDVAALLDALVAIGRAEDVALAWAEFGLGRQLTGPTARLAAARGLFAAGDWRRGLEELWRVELTQPGRDDQAAIARAARMLAAAPLPVLEAALGDRLAAGSHALARWMARDIADFAPGAGTSAVVLRALGRTAPIEFDPAWLARFPAETPGRRAIDAVFAAALGGGAGADAPAAGATDPAVARADHLVNHWLDAVSGDAGTEDPAALAEAAAYCAAQALARYLAATTAAPSPLAGGYRTVAAEALGLVWRQRGALGDRQVRALLGALDPVLRRADRWLGNAWLGSVERSCAIDERAHGDVAGFARDHATVSARILGPEETAVLSASLVRLHRDRPDGWAAAVAAQASRLAAHTGSAGAVELADAAVAQLAAREIETEDAIDVLSTACYLAEGVRAEPCVHAARVLFAAGRGPAALDALCAGLGAASDDAWRAAQLGELGELWAQAGLDAPPAAVERTPPERRGRTGDPIAAMVERIVAQITEAVERGEPARGEQLGRLAIAIDPLRGEAQHRLGIALAHQGKLAEALHHLTRALPEQASQMLAELLHEAGRLPDALRALDYASQRYARADQWLGYAAIAEAADPQRAVAGYAAAYALDREAFGPAELHGYASALEAVGDPAACEPIAIHLQRVAGDDLGWKTHAWSHLARAYTAQGRFEQAVEHAQWAVDHNPLPDSAVRFAATLERARAGQRGSLERSPAGSPERSAAGSPEHSPVALADEPATTPAAEFYAERTAERPPPDPPPGRSREPVFEQLERGEFAAVAAQIADPSWRVRRAALSASRYRDTTDRAVEVSALARAAALAVLADSAGQIDREAAAARAIALAIREQGEFSRDPMPALGEPVARDAFHRELRIRGEPIAGDDLALSAPAVDRFVDRVVIPNGRIARISDYVALLRDLAALTPREALAQFDLDDAGYLEVAAAWAAAIEADPSLADRIADGLARP